MQEQTVLLIKPNAVKERNISTILKMIEDNGFEIIAVEMKYFDRSFFETFYSAHKSKPFYKKLIDFMVTDRCVAVLLQKETAVEDLRKLAGDTDPALAEKGTIRHLYGLDVTRNAVHSSDSHQTALRERELLFPNLKN